MTSAANTPEMSRPSRTAIEVVTIGDELLLGFTVDTNAAALARSLASIGMHIVRRATSGDDPEQIAAVVRELLGPYLRES